MRRLITRLRGALDDPNPIVVKELRSIFRTKLYVRFLYLSTFAVAGVVLLAGATIVEGSLSPAEAGRVLYQIFFTLCAVVLGVVGPVYGAASITSEREAFTYESVLLTGMDPARIVMGKFWAAYASLALVLVALAPIGGVVFLFGGVAPSYVLVAFASLLLLLLPSVAYGVAISAHVPTSRLAILIALGTWPIVVLFGFGAFGLFGLEMQSRWDLHSPGPFWFAEALVERLHFADTLFIVALLPLYLIATAVWFCLAAAIAGVRPTAEDRSTSLKQWALGSLLGPLVLVAVTTLLSHGSDARDAFAIILGCFFFALYFYVNVLVNEPPLPPRVVDSARGPVRRALFRAFGPGARPSMHFGAAFMSLAMTLLVCVFGGCGLVMRSATLEDVLGFALVGVAMLAFAAFLLALGTLVRVQTRRGGAARAALFGVTGALTTLPTIAAIILDARVLDDLDRHLPAVLGLSPWAPIAGAVFVAQRHTNDLWMLVPFTLLYGLLALALYLRASARIGEIARDVDLTRAALLRRVEEEHAARGGSA